MPIWLLLISKWLDGWLLTGSVILEDKSVITVLTTVRFSFLSKQKPGKLGEKEERRNTYKI